jgi:hypothetical protein
MNRIIFDLKILFIPCRENEYKPHFLKGRFLLYYALALVVLNILAASFIISLPKTAFFADVVEGALFNLTNQERVTLGLSSLQESPRLNQVAQQKANDMLANGYFDHYSPTGVSPWYWFKNVGYNYQAAGENLAIGFVDSEEVVDAWIDSPGHRANLFSPHFEEMGIAVLTGEFNGSETTVVVQVFGSPAESKTNVVPEEIKIQEEAKAEEKKEIVQQPIVPAVAAAAQFITVDYFNLAKKILCVSLALIILALILDIVIEFKIQDKSLIIKSLLIIVLLALLIFLMDKQLILRLIPHNLQI